MEIMRFNEENLMELIGNINLLHKEFSENWLKSIKEGYNLKRNQIRHICDKEIDLKFLSYVNSYCDQLNDLQFDPLYNDLDQHLQVKSRVKEPASRFSKIMHYRTDRNENGSVNINKCLNDLMGFRVWIDNFIHSEETCSYLKSLLEKESIKVHNSCKGEYKATHLYFQNGNNKFFPWELQIWNPTHHTSNDMSHKLHKQGYAKWPGIYIETTKTKAVKENV